ncbi:hypothetical protein BBR47_53480 [Brevibacillus brevis NBRC 100599]|uniref:Uncharacterized protein n=1 Tax=Brevibacillus brevis (strain 47 / JCM 6285 / NBRC 100599) TaxID=358681 RepID=C0Z6X6_BREBN|nr:hypothetical protein [Brevibacillus brevis]BAH43923.1 hypothetical protein BBR47_29460 [Brevibacillus brevis NBRC 100599]BAH46325.1 hypothetical protein BBR47_53480 [Brevibacillus brevis NBRC 100599]
MKRILRTAVLSTVLGVLALSTSIAIAAESNAAPLGSGDDFGIDMYASNIHDITGKSAYMWAYTEGEGSELAKVRVYSYFYVNGKMEKADYENGTRYASIDYDASAKYLMDAKITSSHYAYNKAGDKVTRTSEKVYQN